MLDDHLIPEFFLDIKTKAEKKGGDYIINGSKMWITNAHQVYNINDNIILKYYMVFLLKYPFYLLRVLKYYKFDKFVGLWNIDQESKKLLVNILLSFSICNNLTNCTFYYIFCPWFLAAPIVAILISNFG